MGKNPYPKGTRVRFRGRGLFSKNGEIVRAWQNKLADASHPGWWYEIEYEDGGGKSTDRVYHTYVIGKDK